VERSDKLVYLTYFNAGLRIVDISDARQPREVGYFIPPEPDQALRDAPHQIGRAGRGRAGGFAGGYLRHEKNQGLWIL